MSDQKRRQSSFSLEPLEAADVPAAISLYFSAFDNSHSLSCWPRTEPVHKWWQDLLKAKIQEPGAHAVKAVSEDTGEIVGFAQWVEPTKRNDRAGSVPKEWPEGVDVELCAATFAAFAEGREEVMGDDRHWYLDMLATAPEYQHQGAGSLMLDWGLEQADGRGEQVFLGSTPEAVHLYEKAGFQFISDEKAKQEWHKDVFMIRRPSVT